MDPYRSTVATQPASFTASGALSINKVLRNTYLLLSATLLFSAAMAGLAMLVGLPYGAGLICSLVALGLLWFVVPRTAHSINGIYAVFAVTGLLGFGLGPVTICHHDSLRTQLRHVGKRIADHHACC